MGVGIHGEPGRRRVKLAPADAIADEMVGAISGDLGTAGDALLLVNGFGGTPLMELYLMYHAARTRLEKRGFAVRRSLVGNYVTSLDMAGCSITVTAASAPSAARAWTRVRQLAACEHDCPRAAAEDLGDGLMQRLLGAQLPSDGNSELPIVELSRRRARPRAPRRAEARGCPLRPSSLRRARP